MKLCKCGGILDSGFNCISCGHTHVKLENIKILIADEGSANLPIERNPFSVNKHSLECELHSEGKQCECFVSMRVICPKIACMLPLKILEE
jgi:hypothetical protein